MRLTLGCAVQGTDAPFGELADVVVDPLSLRVTHLVVAPHGRPNAARLVPVERASAAGELIALDLPVADISALEAPRESAYLRVGEFAVADPDWEIGIQDVLLHPLYQEVDGITPAFDPDPHVLVSYDRIPQHTIEIRRSSAVMSADGHRLGHVDGFLVGSGDRADIVLEHGHLWGRREIVIPAAAVAHVENDSVTLSVTKDEVEALPARRVHRWF